MLTYEVTDYERYEQTELKRIEGWCLSADTKPTTGIANGSVIIEMDTGSGYMFDQTNSTWRAI